MLAVNYHGLQGVHRVDGDDSNRNILGGLKSGLWYVERLPSGEGNEAVQPDVWTFRGGGLCHRFGNPIIGGALGMADAGLDYPDILKH